MNNGLGWKDEYRVGNDLIDGQHRELFSICRTIEELAGSDKPLSKPEVHSQLVNLFEEFRNHFDEEMQLYRRVYRLDYMEHEQHHADFLEKLADVLDQSAKGVPDLGELLRFVKGWFVRHILVEDIPQFNELRQRGLADTAT
jgi:hemerythrin